MRRPRIGQHRGARVTGTALLAAALLAAGGVPASAHDRNGTPGYLDPRLPVAARVSDLLTRMTLAEKIGQMTQAERGSVDGDQSQITSLALGSLLSGGG